MCVRKRNLTLCVQELLGNCRPTLSSWALITVRWSSQVNVPPTHISSLKPLLTLCGRKHEDNRVGGYITGYISENYIHLPAGNKHILLTELICIIKLRVSTVAQSCHWEFRPFPSLYFLPLRDLVSHHILVVLWLYVSSSQPNRKKQEGWRRNGGHLQ